MAKTPTVPATPWTANSTTPYADQSYMNGDRPAGGGSTPAERQFTIDINAVGGTLGVKPQNGTGVLSGKDVFTSDAGTAEYSNERTFNGENVIKTRAPTGSTGFGQFGGIFDFEGSDAGKVLLSGDEVWVRTRILIPTGFAYNVNGRNKFLRLRSLHPTDVSEGYNDLYMHGGNSTPWDWIFEGEQNWLWVGDASDALVEETWKTIEYYHKFDHLKDSEGGVATVRIWVDDELIGETFERRTMNQSDSYIQQLNFFTYWDDVPPTVEQTVYVHQIEITSAQPTNQDAAGNYYLGVDGGV